MATTSAFFDVQLKVQGRNPGEDGDGDAITVTVAAENEREAAQRAREKFADRASRVESVRREA